MLMSAAALPTWAAASAVTPKTYIAKQSIEYNEGFKNQDGYVSCNYFVYNDGQKVIFDNSISDYYEELRYFNPMTYVRSNIIYYGLNSDFDTNKLNYLCSSDLGVVDGKGKKVLYKGKAYIEVIGGYGAAIIFCEGSTVKKYYKGKVSKLFKVNESNANYKSADIFNGKLYYENKSYDLKTGKISVFEAKRFYPNSKYLIYINKNNNLKKMDCSGNRTMVDTNVYKHYFSNSSPTVVYSKLDKSGNEIFYKRTGDGNPIKLTTMNDMLNTLIDEMKHDPYVTNKNYSDYFNRSNVEGIVITVENKKVNIYITVWSRYDIGANFTIETSGKNFALKDYHWLSPEEMGIYD
ncbi:MAG: hypothetical protein ACI4GY_07745, partial [Acutalibacteraceae bacterium]